jgi:cell division protein FtsW
MKKEGGDLKKVYGDIKNRAKGYDLGIIVSVFFLSAMGMLMVYSTSSVYALEKFGDQSYFLKHHIVYLFIGLVGMVGLMFIDYRVLRRFAYPMYVAGLFLLVLVLIPGIGKDVSGARRWMDIGFITFQPSEVAKFLLIIYLAHSLAKKRDKMDTFWVGCVSHILMAGLYVALILLEPDFGTATILVVSLFGMLFIGEAKVKYLVILGVFSLAFLALAVLTEGYRMSRVLSFIDPWKDPLGSGYQSIQSFVAFGLGGFWGSGLGDSSQKLFFLPQAHTDFIFSIIGEELGFIGVLLIVSGFVFFVFRCLKVALNAPDVFGCYLVFGCTLLIGIQAGTNMAVAVGLFPTKGLTLPFISYGGTSLISSLGAVGMILSVSRAGIK